jgi:hypothetical protein
LISRVALEKLLKQLERTADLLFRHLSQGRDFLECAQVVALSACNCWFLGGAAMWIDLIDTMMHIEGQGEDEGSCDEVIGIVPCLCQK